MSDTFFENDGTSSSSRNDTFFENDGTATDTSGWFSNPNAGNIYYENSGETSTDSGSGGVMPTVQTIGASSDPDLFNKLKGFAKDLYTDSRGNLDFAKIATLLGGGFGAFNANKGLQGGAGAGYQGGIPTLYAGRTMMTAPPTMVGGKPRRPGQGGIDYGGNVTYFTSKPEAPANPLAAFPSESKGAKSALEQGLTPDQYLKNIKDWLQAHPNASDAEVRAQMDAMGISVADVAKAKGEDLGLIQGRYDTAFTQGTAEQKARAYKMLLDQGLTDEQIRNAIEGTAGRQADTDWSYLQNLSRGNQGGNTQAPSRSAGLTYALNNNMTEQQYLNNIENWLQSNKNATDREVADQMQKIGISAEDLVRAHPSFKLDEIKQKLRALGVTGYAEGGKARYLRGETDGMADEIPSSIGGREPAALSHGEFVIPADVVSHLGNGNSDAGAKKLYQMMDKLRMARTGTKKQGKKINPDKFMPGGTVQGYAEGGSTDDYFSVLEERDLSNPRYREYLARQQGLEGSHPEMFAAPIARGLGSLAKTARGMFAPTQKTTTAFVAEGPGSVLKTPIGAPVPEITVADLERFLKAARSSQHIAKQKKHFAAQLPRITEQNLMQNTPRNVYNAFVEGRNMRDLMDERQQSNGMASGGAVKRFQTGGTTGVAPAVNAGVTGLESNLSNWAGPYVTNMLGKGMALSEMPYQAYTGPLTAGQSALQEKVSTGLQGLNFPGNLGQTFSSSGTPTIGPDGKPVDGSGIASNYMNPYLKNVLDPQLEELRRQSQINLQPGLAKLTQAGGYGGGRQAIMESEANRNLLNAQNTAIGTGYANAYDKAMQQFNTEQGQAKTLADMMAGQGATDRAITAEGIAADKTQFEEARENPFKMVQYQQSLLQGMPLSSQAYNTTGESAIVAASKGAKTVQELLNALGIRAG